MADSDCGWRVGQSVMGQAEGGVGGTNSFAIESHASTNLISRISILLLSSLLFPSMLRLISGNTSLVLIIQQLHYPRYIFPCPNTHTHTHAGTAPSLSLIINNNTLFVGEECLQWDGPPKACELLPQLRSVSVCHQLLSTNWMRS